MAGFPEVEFGDAFADRFDPRPPSRLQVDEPISRMTFGVSTSPIAVGSRSLLTSRQIRDRLVALNVVLRLVVVAKPVSRPYAVSVMATNTGSGYRKGAVTGRTQVKNPRTGLWTKRDTTTGQFTTVKKTGGTFKGIKREK